MELKNLLTITQNCGIITTKDKEKDTLKNRKGIITMKKASLQSLITFIDSMNEQGSTTQEIMEIKAELEAEVNKGAEEKAARAAAYAGIHDVIVDNLTDTPVTCADLFAEIESDITAAGMSRHNVQYALNNLWQDEIEKIPGKPNTYKRR